MKNHPTKDVSMNVYIKEGFWFNLDEEIFSFRFKGLQKGLHFTFSFNSSCEEVNFHVSRNIGEPNNKPKIEIVRIPKEDLQLGLPGINLIFLQSMLEPIRFRSIRRKSGIYNKHILYCSFDRLLPQERELVETELTKRFSSFTKSTKRRIEIKKGAFATLSELPKSPLLQQIAQKNLKTLANASMNRIESGFLVSKQYTGTVIIINKRWYKLRDTNLIQNFLKNYLGNKLTATLKFKIMMAMARVGRAGSYDEVKEYNKPLLFRLNSSKPIPQF